MLNGAERVKMVHNVTKPLLKELSHEILNSFSDFANHFSEIFLKYSFYEKTVLILI